MTRQTAMAVAKRTALYDRCTMCVIDCEPEGYIVLSAWEAMGSFTDAIVRTFWSNGTSRAPY